MCVKWSFVYPRGKRKDWFSKIDIKPSGCFLLDSWVLVGLMGAFIIGLSDIFELLFSGGFQRDMLDDPVQESLETVADSKPS